MNNDAPSPDRDFQIPYAAWRAPDMSPDFRAAVWQRIEARRAHPVAWWTHVWAQSRLAYAGALLATAMLWAVVSQVTPPARTDSRMFSAVEPGTLTAAFAHAVQGE